MAAVAVAEAARELGAASTRIKWPNDSDCRGRKLAGLLAELRAEGERIRHVVLGIGFNVSLHPADFPEDLRSSATSLLMESGEQKPRPVVCARILEHLEEWLSLHETEGFGPVAERWRELSSTSGIGCASTPGKDPSRATRWTSPRTATLLVREEGGRMVKVMAGDVERCTLV